MRRATWALGLCCVLLSCGGDGGSSGDGGRDAPQVLSENTAAMCQDGQDNDGDGFSDCSDQDCWPLTLCAESRPDGWKPPTDGGPGDFFHDGPYQADGAVSFDTGLQSCAIHYDCPQREFCYKGKCLRDPKQAVFHCGKAGCPPGHGCLNQANARDRCAEDPSYVCNDACDCGPAHCCLNNRCVRDLADPWITGPVVGASPPGKCKQGTDATYCCADTTCHAGRMAYGVAATQFRCHARNGGEPAAHCGGGSCYGTACNCAPGESCVDTVEQPGSGKTCGLLSGGSCVSSALAEAVFGWAPADLLRCCASGCTAGSRCDQGWVRRGGRWSYQRLVATCGACGDGVCGPGEYPGTCPADCRCGDGACAPEEVGRCAADCGECGNAVCEQGESPANCNADCSSCGDGWCAATEDTQGCPQDCAGICGDGRALPPHYRICGDGICQDSGCPDPETCRTCPQDCGPCEIVEHRRGVAWTAEALRGVWASSAGELFAVGDSGTTVRHDGADWRPIFSPTTVKLNDVFGFSSVDVFAAGAGGTLLRYDGIRWTRMAAGNATELWALWGNAPDAVFAVGNAGTILRFDGAAWTPMSSGTTSALRGVWGTSATDVIAVGAGPTVLRFDGSHWHPAPVSLQRPTLRGLSASVAVGDDGAILHRDPSGFWRAKGSGTSAALEDVWDCTYTKYATMPPQQQTTAFAVGAAGTLLRNDGDSWSIVGTGTGQRLRAIGGMCVASPGVTGAVAVGDNGTILHFSLASGWAPKPSGTSAVLHSVWSPKTSNLPVAVGEQGTILHYALTGWAAKPSPTGQALYGVWGSGTVPQFAVGQGGTLLEYDAAAGEWHSANSGTQVDLHAVAGSSATDAYAVGAAGIVLHFDGATWSAAPSPTAEDLVDVWAGAGIVRVLSAAGRIFTFQGAWAEDGMGILNAVWGSSPSDIFAVGTAGMILHYDGSTWTATSEATGYDLFDVWGRSATDVFAVGEAGVSLRFDGTTWKEEAADATNDLHAVAGGGCCTFAVGAGGTVRRRDGSGWASITPATATLIDVWSAGPNHAVVAGTEGRMLLYDGQAWQAQATGTAADFAGLWGRAAYDLFAVQPSGAVYHYDGTHWSHHSVTPAGLNALAGYGPNGLVAVGGRWVQTSCGFWGSTKLICKRPVPVVALYDGSAWDATPSTLGSVFTDVLSFSSAATFAVGGLAYKFDGTAWTSMGYSGPSLASLWGSSATDVFAAGAAIAHYDGVGWTSMQTPAATFKGVAGMSHSDVLAVGVKSAIAHFDGAGWTPARLDLRTAGTASYRCPAFHAASPLGAGDYIVVGEDDTIVRFTRTTSPIPRDGGVTVDGGSQDGAPPDLGLSSDVTPPGPACPDGACDIGESCDGRSGTVACPQDCPFANLGHPQKEYCFVNGVCEGPGCP